ncbi:MAG TPA: acyl-CoA dehydrogenase, partial [Trinickia sp.]
GMGFIEETGAAQYYRDARILPIYEGTTAIQANDLVGRKTLRDDGAVAKQLLASVGETVDALGKREGAAFSAMRDRLATGQRSLAAAVEFTLANAKSDPNAVFAGSVLYLKLAGIVLCGWQMARALLVAADKEQDDPAFFSAKIATARFYAEHVLPQAPALEAAIVSARGREGVYALTPEQF